MLSRPDTPAAVSVPGALRAPMSVPHSRTTLAHRVRDAESLAWLERLRSDGPTYDQALLELRGLLLGAARFEVNRRRASMPHLRGDDHDDVAQQSANDALVAILRKLESFRGDSRFTTWAYKFALLEAGVRLRRLAWQSREIPLESEGWSLIADPGGEPSAGAESRELITALNRAITDELTPHQREVLVALTLNDVPIDVLAERLSTTRGALYKTTHDARRKLRACLSHQGFTLDQGETG